jgi:hypothetical protein
VDEDVLGLDRGEAIAAMLADPLGKARRERRELEVRPVLLESAPRSAMPRKPVDSVTIASAAPSLP